MQANHFAVLVEERAVPGGIQPQPLRRCLLESGGATHRTLGEAGHLLPLGTRVHPATLGLLTGNAPTEGDHVAAAAVEGDAVTAHDFIVQPLLHEWHQHRVRAFEQAAPHAQRMQPACALHAGVAQRTGRVGRKAGHPVRRAPRGQPRHIQRHQLPGPGQDRHRHRQVLQRQCRVQGIEGVAQLGRRARRHAQLCMPQLQRLQEHRPAEIAIDHIRLHHRQAAVLPTGMLAGGHPCVQLVRHFAGPLLQRDYGERIPVVAVDGQEACDLGIDTAEVERLLARVAGS